MLGEVGNTAHGPNSPAQQRRSSAAAHKKSSTTSSDSAQYTACDLSKEQQALVHSEAAELEQQPEQGASFASDDNQDKSAKPSNSTRTTMPQPLTSGIPTLGSLEVRSSFLSRGPNQPNARHVQRLFASTQAPAHAAAAASVNAVPQVAGGDSGNGAITPATAMDQMQQEIVRLQEERARVARLRVQLEEGAARLAAEQAAFERRKAEEAARVEAERVEGQRKLARDRRVLEKQSRAIMRLPSQLEKEEVKAVEVRAKNKEYGSPKPVGELGALCAPVSTD